MKIKAFYRAVPSPQTLWNPQQPQGYTSHPNHSVTQNLLIIRWLPNPLVYPIPRQLSSRTIPGPSGSYRTLAKHSTTHAIQSVESFGISDSCLVSPSDGCRTFANSISHPSKHGPVIHSVHSEVILTASKAWFKDTYIKYAICALRVLESFL